MAKQVISYNLSKCLDIKHGTSRYNALKQEICSRTMGYIQLVPSLLPYSCQEERMIWSSFEEQWRSRRINITL
jgi:hypothetical protein